MGERPLKVWGPLGERVTVSLFFLGATKLFFDAGPLLKGWDPLFSGTYGIGEVLLEACVLGVEHVVVRVPGKSPYDGGMGILEALGVEFLDAQGRRLSGMGDNLKRVVTLDLCNLIMKPRTLEVEVAVGCEEPSSSLGEDVRRFARVIERCTGERVFWHHGGVGMSLETFWGAKIIGGEGV